MFFFVIVVSFMICASFTHTFMLLSGKDLGFKSSLFNLVFANNTASVRLWRKLGYTELSCIPKVANLKGCDELIDAYQFHFDFSTLE